MPSLFTRDYEIYKPDGEKIPNNNWTTMIPTLNENYFIVSDSNFLYGVIDKNNNQIIPNSYTYISYLENDNFAVCNQNGKYGIINKEGKSTIEINYDSIQKINNTQIIQVVNGENTYFYNNNFERILETKEPVIQVEEKMIKVYSNLDMFYINTEGKLLTNKEVYPENNLYTAKKDGKYGFVDKNGNIALDYQYEFATELNQSGFAGIKKDGKWGVINKEGKIILEPIYVLDDIAPDFIGTYYKVNSNYGDVYYTNNIEEIEE